VAHVPANRGHTSTNHPSPEPRVLIGYNYLLEPGSWRNVNARQADVNCFGMLYYYCMKEDQRLYQERIVADPRILAGKPVVKGTRIAVDLVLEELAQNPDITELLAAHPDLTRDDVQACLAYAKDLVTGEEVSPKPPKGARSDAAL
jgi:uncharacterized protein (DUF433 family)